MNYIDQLGKPSFVGKVRVVKNNNCLLYIEARNGNVITASRCDPFDFSVDDIVLIDEDNYIVAAPSELWFSEPFVGVVRIANEEVTVVDTGGRWQIIKTNENVDYKVGNTVEVQDATGVTRILSETPIKLIDLPEVDSAVVEKFKLKKKNNRADLADFGGLKEVVERANELIGLKLDNREALTKINARPIKGVMFTGAPGTGKTLLAKIIANSTDATFYEISGPEILSKWYGQSEELMRLLFEDAAKQEKAIIFFDEIDSIAGKRDDASHEASRQIVAQLLTCMDGFTTNNNVVVIAATNRPQDIDSALLRPGRFDWEIHFPMPDQVDRKLILEASSRNLNTTGSLPHELISIKTHLWSAAELSAIWSEAALLAISDSRTAIATEDYIGGFERVAAQKQNNHRTRKDT